MTTHQRIPLKHVVSSQVRSIGYDPSSKTLHVEYHPKKDAPIGKQGALYEYRNVPEEAYDKLMRAESLGTHLNAIKGQYRHNKLN